MKLVELSKPYECLDGITRYVILMIKLGRGYSILWDSVPTSREYWSDMDAMELRQKTGMRGYIAQAKFIKMIKHNAVKEGE